MSEDAPEVVTVEVPTAVDLRRAVDGVLRQVGSLPDDAWDAPAHGLVWDCRDTAAHLVDDLGFYAMQLSGTRPPQTSYVALLDPPPASPRWGSWRPCCTRTTC